jgi:hypothetical protein
MGFKESNILDDGGKNKRKKKVYKGNLFTFFLTHQRFYKKNLINHK